MMLDEGHLVQPFPSFQKADKGSIVSLWLCSCTVQFFSTSIISYLQSSTISAAISASFQANIHTLPPRLETSLRREGRVDSRNVATLKYLWILCLRCGLYVSGKEKKKVPFQWLNTVTIYPCANILFGPYSCRFSK